MKISTITIRKRVSFILILLLIIYGSCSGQKMDLLILKDSTKVYGTIIEHIPNQNITIRLLDQTEVVYFFSQIDRITSVSLKKEPKSLKKKNYPEIGINFGLPAGINLSAGYLFGPFVLRVSGMYYHEFYGVQLNAGIRTTDNVKFRHVLSAVIGRSVNDIDFDGLYGGFAWDFFVKGFFLEIGATYGKYFYHYDRYQYEFSLAFQVGYTYRFVQNPL
jgi:hypothetical protein